MEDPIYDFPNYLADNDFEGLQRLLVSLSSSNEKNDRNRSIVGKKATSFETTMQNYEYLDEIIRNLKSEGAFLNEIRP